MKYIGFFLCLLVFGCGSQSVKPKHPLEAFQEFKPQDKSRLLSIKNKFQGGILTPENVEDVNLSKLKLGYTYTLEEVTKNDLYVYELIKTSHNEYRFEFLINGEASSLNYHVLNNSGAIIKSAVDDGESKHCYFKTGNCRYYLKSKIGPLYRLWQTKFEDSIWRTKIYASSPLTNGKVSVSVEFNVIYDTNGLPIYRQLIIPYTGKKFEFYRQ